ncbi:16S rRNA (cytosine(1402)-N(4))-methyltransferase RsmH [Candidatus Riesia pediculicola]|uniref:16S rRNA (cytosine(1402)-N(4))-methyltransferase RsmH n=1 Tax=Candidatus Riesia pediculicola TaxID=401619 RepID=UPI0009B7625F|nr:16S rRNA (cytosine(1402)-N(4))-methyltransferase RsmH [Candidatus Riesia pediculicola]ARC53940.1 ribosomal RNA small subunit methyltransferase H [Candidatus Riesia pediculicola]
MKELNHIAVLPEEVIEGLNIKRDGTYIDCTFGQGGHSKLILSKLEKKGKLIAIDRDPKSISVAKKIKDSRFIIKHGLFSDIYQFAKEEKIVGKVNGILLDLGISMIQINDENRGFSFRRNGSLDMRMNPEVGIPAKKWLEKAKREEIELILRRYGEEKKSRKISRSIFRQNHKKNLKKITSTKQLVEIVSQIVSYKRKHPATRTFQAIRIHINNELEELKEVLEKSLMVLAPLSRIAVISFHSLESRIIKNFIKKYDSNSIINKKTFKKNIPEYIKLKLIEKIKPKRSEVYKNPKSRSALLRIIQFYIHE